MSASMELVPSADCEIDCAVQLKSMLDSKLVELRIREARPVGQLHKPIECPHTLLKDWRGVLRTFNGDF